MCVIEAILTWALVGYVFMFFTRLFYRLQKIYCTDQSNRGRYDDEIVKLKICDFYEPPLWVGCMCGFFMVPVCIGMLIVLGVNVVWLKATKKYKIDHDTVLWK